MIPLVIYEKLTTDTALALLGITMGKVFELQSVDERPLNSGYFVILNWQESSSFVNAVKKAPRTLTVWVHTPLDRTRDYRVIDKILNRIDAIFDGIEQQKGADGVRVTCITRQGRSGNLVDDGWKTISRNATYSVLYDESSV